LQAKALEGPGEGHNGGLQGQHKQVKAFHGWKAKFL
jgi:hypothetical protein